MAMEIKTLDVKNSEEQSTIEFWSQFGWVLKSSQRGYNKDSHLETRGEDTYSVTETVDFTKLVFERDKNAPNYGKIVSLEKEYFEIQASMPNEEPKVNCRHYNSIEAFAEGAKPDVRTFKQFAPTLFPGIIGAVLAFAGLFVLGSLGFVKWIIAAAGAAILVVSFVIGSSRKKTALASALDKTDEECRKKLEHKYAENNKKYDEESGKVREYNQKKSRINEILKELDSLI